MGRDATAPAELACLLTWRQGEFSDGNAVAETIAGADAVCCVFGPRFLHQAVFLKSA